MVFKLFSNLKKFQKTLFAKKGISLVEVIVTIFLISIFSSILIANFPELQRQFALSRAAYKFAQDLRRTQDLGLSGVQILDIGGQPITVKGYGIYIDLTTQPTTEYSIYADVDGNHVYYPASYNYCSQVSEPTADCIIEKTNIKKTNPSLYIKEFVNINGLNYTSINFRPPDPIVEIQNKCQQACADSDNSRIGIVFAVDSDAPSTRTIWVNTSGMIKVQ
jgi:type II secretory pathway pseudopilin PulG